MIKVVSKKSKGIDPILAKDVNFDDVVTRFWDMCSGGGVKLEWAMIYISLPEDEAIKFFKKYFKRDPEHVTCDTCGEDYHVQEFDSVAQASAYHRHCDFDRTKQEWVEEVDPMWGSWGYKYQTVEEYFNDKNVLYVRVLN